MMPFKPLSQIEAQVYAVMRDYLKKFKDINLETLLPYCYRALGKYIPPNKINDAVNELIQKRYFIKGSSLSQEEILQNPVRKQILNYIQLNPGTYNRSIRRELNIGSNEFNWHMGMLEKFGFIKKIPFNRSFGYFENRSYMGHEQDLFLLQNEKARAVIKYIEQHPKSSLSIISKDLEMHYSTVQKHVDEFVSRSILVIKQEGKHVYYDLNEELFDKIRKIINGAVFIEFAE